MALKLPGQWVWDSWFAFDAGVHHAFYLQASRALGDPNRRHRNTSVGHSISTDLKNWTVLRDALTPSESPAFDSWTTWTGSVVRHDGKWWMFYTGTSREDAGQRQSIGLALSDDLITWTKHVPATGVGTPLVAADSRWYQTLEGGFKLEPFRDPWVFRFKDAQGNETGDWHMLATASAATSTTGHQDAVMAHATSPDLLNWTVQPPLSEPLQGFGETEVFQFEVVDGVPVLLFCCGPIWLHQSRLDAGERGGVYSLAVAPDLSDVDFNRSVLFDAPGLYASRLVRDESGWNLIGFWDAPEGEFVGELCDPIPVTADPILGLVRR
jgi:beta-fructofuranosidase